MAFTLVDSGPIPVATETARMAMLVVATLSTQNVIAVPGVLYGVLLNTAAGGNIRFYDNTAGDTSGTVFFLIVSGAAIGTFYGPLGLPFANGLTIQQLTAGSTMTIYYSTR